MPKERTDRIYEPQRHGKRWRVTIDGADGSRSYARESDEGPAGFATEEAARAYVAAWRADAHERTLTGAVAEYLDHRRTIGKRPGTVTTDGYRLRGLMQHHVRDRLLSSITSAVAHKMFDERKAALVKKRGKLAYDTALGELSVVRAFFAWCIRRGWLNRDPFDAIELEGKKATRKTRHRIDEGRQFLDYVLANPGPQEVAAAMALLMDLRASEIIERVVRDIDDNGRVLWIDHGKTDGSERHLEIPTALRAPLVALCAGRRPNAPLFPGRSRHWVGYHVRRLCRLAGVPILSPHGLRRTHASISAREVEIEHVAAALGHSSPAVTRRHYVAPGAEQSRRSREVAARLTETN